MHDAEYPVGLHGAHGVASATLCCWDAAPECADRVLLRLEAENHWIEVLADNYTDALNQVRAQLEALGMLIDCNGASENAHASGMSAGMGLGDRAYPLTLGRAATTADLVCIFDAGCTAPSTLAAQEAFYERWLESLGR